MFTDEPIEKLSVRLKRIKELEEFYRWLAFVRRKLELQEHIDIKKVNQRIAVFFKEHPILPSPPKKKKHLQSHWVMKIIDILSAFGTGCGFAGTLVAILIHFHLVAASIMSIWGIPIACALCYVFYQSLTGVDNKKGVSFETRVTDIELIVLKQRMIFLREEYSETCTTYLKSLMDCMQIIAPGNTAQNENKMVHRLEKLLKPDPELLLHIKPLLLERQQSNRLKKTPIKKSNVLSRSKRKRFVKLKSLGFGCSIGISTFGLILSIIAAIKLTAGLTVLALGGPFGWAIIAGAIAIGLTIGVAAAVLYYIKLRKLHKMKRDLSQKKRRIWKILNGIKAFKLNIHKVQKKSQAITVLKQQLYIDFIKKANTIEEKFEFSINSARSTVQLSQALVSHPDCLTLYAPIKKQLLTAKESLIRLISQIECQRERMQGLPSHFFLEHKPSFDVCLIRYQALYKQAKQHITEIDAVLAAINLQEQQQKPKTRVLAQQEGDHRPQHDYHKTRSGLFRDNKISGGSENLKQVREVNYLSDYS